MQHFGHWETLLHSRFPEQQLVVRNLGWSADTITLRLRSLNAQDHGHTLFDHQPDIILAFFGANESFAGPAGLDQFKQDLAAFLSDVRQLKYPIHTFRRGGEPEVKDGSGDVSKTPQLVLISPIANENLTDRWVRWRDLGNIEPSRPFQDYLSHGLADFRDFFNREFAINSDLLSFTANISSVLRPQLRDCRSGSP